MLTEEIGRLFTWSERHRALFFATAQILTVSSSMKNPVTHAGQVVDVGLEMWGVFVITAVAGSFAAFFRAGDS